MVKKNLGGMGDIYIAGNSEGGQQAEIAFRDVRYQERSEVMSGSVRVPVIRKKLRQIIDTSM